MHTARVAPKAAVGASGVVKACLNWVAGADGRAPWTISSYPYAAWHTISASQGDRRPIEGMHSSGYVNVDDQARDDGRILGCN